MLASVMFVVFVLSSCSLDLVVQLEMDEPINIALSGGRNVLGIGSDMTIVAMPDRPVDSYAWYLNGRQIPGEKRSSLTIGNELMAGQYRLDVFVGQGSIASSAFHLFEVRAGIKQTAASADPRAPDR